LISPANAEPTPTAPTATAQNAAASEDLVRMPASYLEVDP
jgi:hypothetical protein